MDIVMLGHSSSGKTTYMAALYYRMTNGLYDYKMRYDQWGNYWYKRYTQNNKNYTILEAEKEEKDLERTSLNVSKGIYPPPTAIKQEYVFKMQYKSFNEIAFNWFDYRAGALMERSSQSTDTASLISKIRNSDALIVFLDGTKLEEPLSQNEREFKRLVYLIKNVISNVYVEERRYFPISFVITKEDLCTNVLESEGFNFFWDNILNDINQSNKIASLITWATINNEHIYNVHWPLFFSIKHCMHKFANEVFSSYQRREKDRGVFGSIKEFFTDEDKNATMRAINELQKSEQTLAQILNEEDKKCLYLI